MSARIYLMLDVAEGKSDRVARTLSHMPGVIQADCLEGGPDVMAIVEAADRPKLAEITMTLLAAVGSAVDDVRMLVALSETSITSPVFKLEDLRPLAPVN